MWPAALTTPISSGLPRLRLEHTCTNFAISFQAEGFPTTPSSQVYRGLVCRSFPQQKCHAVLLPISSLRSSPASPMLAPPSRNLNCTGMEVAPQTVWAGCWCRTLALSFL